MMPECWFVLISVYGRSRWSGEYYDNKESFERSKLQTTDRQSGLSVVAFMVCLYKTGLWWTVKQASKHKLSWLITGSCSKQGGHRAAPLCSRRLRNISHVFQPFIWLARWCFLAQFKLLASVDQISTLHNTWRPGNLGAMVIETTCFHAKWFGSCGSE